jgi:hypothetical protein
MDSNPGKTSTENINEVILRLLRLKSGTELDYQTYAKKIKIKLASSRMVGAFIPAEEDILLREEFKRVRNKEGRFVILTSKKTKVSSPPPPSGSSGGEDTPPKTSAIVKAPPSGKITTEKLFNTPRVEPVNVRDITPDRPSQVDPLIRISNILDSILETLTNINNFDREQATRQRTDAENRRRGQRETDLESKPFEGIKKALSAITKPFQSIWDRIVNFITNVILGRIVIKLLEWFGDPKNQEKIQSIIRFLGDHWPTLLALYLRFGTGIGRFVGKLTRSLVKGSFKLVKLVAGLAAKLGLKRAGKIASFLGGPRGKAIATGVGIAADVAVTAGTAFGASKLFGGEDKKQEPVAPEPVQQFSGGGSVKIPKFAGGGFANFGNMFKGAGMGSMFGPMGMLAGAALGSGKPQEMFSGLVKGPGGPKDDKIPANLSNGEFVMSAGAVKKYGVGTLESMNAAGGGTNIPKIANGIVHAAGGGYVGMDVEKGHKLWIEYLNNNPDATSRGGKLYDRIDPKTREPISDNYKKYHRQFMREYMKNGKPPEWANIKSKTTRVSSPSPGSTQTPPTSSRPPSSTSSARPQPGVGLSTNAKPPVQKINTNMNVPGGRIRGGSLSAIMMALEMKQRKDEGQTNVQAGLGAGGSALGGQLGWMAGAKAGAVAGAALGTIVPGVGNGVGAAVGAIVGGLAAGYGGAMLGGKLADNISGVNAVKERNSRGGIGGLVVGGYGLKKQEFKDAPKTSIITDDKGRPSIGHKALRNGKLHYVRGPQPGTGTKNPLEMLGRFINPSAYKENDAKLERQKHKEAMVNALEGYQAQNMAPDAQARMMKQMGGNLKDVQNDLNYRNKPKPKPNLTRRQEDIAKYKASMGPKYSAANISSSQRRRTPNITPLPRPKPKPIVAGGGSGGRRGGGSRPSSGSRVPSHSATHSSGHRTHKETLGIMR